MSNEKHPLLRVRPVFLCLALLPLIYLYVVAIQFGFYGDWRDAQAENIDEFSLAMGGDTSDITLPYVMTGGSAGEEVLLTTVLEDKGSQRLYVKSVFAPLRVYANDELLYAYGGEGSFPSYLIDPPTVSATAELPNEARIDLCIEFSYPSTRDELILDTIMVGTYPGIFSVLLTQQEGQLFLYITFLVLGVFFICIGLLIRIFEPQGAFFAWLGLIALCCSLWGLGEYDATVLFIHNAGLVSLLTFTSVFYLPVAIHCFFRATVQYHDTRPMRWCISLCLFVATMATVLQATSLCAYYNSLFYFRWFALASFCFGIAYTIYEWRVYKNDLAKWFLLPWCIVILSALVEGIQLMSGGIYANGQFIQGALMLFILLNSLIGGHLLRNAFAMREQNRRMEETYKIMEVQVEEQQRYHHLLMETRQTLREQRHDLHHQLAVIGLLAKEGKLDELEAHLNTMVSAVPEELQNYCSNIAVNAVVAHYERKAKASGIDIAFDLDVPEETPRIGANHLCVIFGNILENAVEACTRMTGEKGFITLQSHVHNKLLIITQKNSFAGALTQINGHYYSSKREEMGIGLASVQSTAQNHGGDASFTAEDGVFQSVIYVEI